MRTSLLVAAALALMLVACGPGGPTYGTVTGTVKGSDGMAMPGTRIKTNPTTGEDTTGGDGRYLIDYIPAGTYSLQLSGSGHLPKEEQFTVKAGETTHLDVTMSMSVRVVSAEMLGTGCRCAIPNRMAMYAVLDSLGDRVSHVEYHATKDTLGEGWEPFLTACAEERRLYYNPEFNKGGWLYPDGTSELQSSADFKRVLDSLLAVPAPVQMQLTGSSDGQAVDIQVQVTGIDAIGSNCRLAMGIVEKGPINYVNGMGDTSYVRDLALNLSCVHVDLTPGETKTFTAHLDIPDTTSALIPPFHIVNKSDIGLIAFVQDSLTKRVHQSASKKL